MGNIALPGPVTLSEKLQARLKGLRGNKFAKNLSTMGISQVAIRISRLLTILVLGYILDPRIYGLAAIVLTIYEFVALFTRNGISASVVKASAADVEVTAMTAYRMTVVVCIGLIAIQCAIAWPLAWLYGENSLALPIAAMSVVYLATPMSIIQAAFQLRENKVNRIALAGAAQVITDNVLTVALAIAGFGLWAIILPKILVAPIWIIIVRYGHAWRPHKISSVSKFEGWRSIAKFSRNVMGVEIMTTTQGNLDNLLVGYFLGAHALGLYYFAFNGGLGITLGIISALSIAVFPHLCEVNGDRQALAKRFRTARKTVAMTIVPIVLLQAILAPVYVPLIFGEKWLPAVPVLSLICLSAVVRPFASVSSQLLKAIGEPGYELKWQMATTLLLVFALLVASQISIVAVAVAVLAVQTVMMGSFAYLTPKKYLNNQNLPDRKEF